MAATLIDSTQRPPLIEALNATEIPLQDNMSTIKIDIHLLKVMFLATRR